MNNFHGLSQEEARQKLQEFGLNEIQEVHKISAFHILLRQVKKNFVIYLLSITAVASFFLGKDITGYIILIVITIVVTTGFVQEYKAEKAISALRKMIMPVSRVIRGGKEHEISSAHIVPGDIVILRMGDKVSADAVVLEESNLKANESILTGEPVDIKKVSVVSRETYADENVVFMGSYIVSGRCVVEVLHTGMNTKFGKIAGMISTAEKQLPLQDKVNNISKYMVIVGITAAVLTGVVLYMRADIITTGVIINILIVVIALCVSSFPEGFPVVLITTLAAGVNRMAKQNAVVNRMSIIETLGETSVICSDKTGTLTKGEMTVRKVYFDGTFHDVSGIGYEAKGTIQELKPEQEETCKKLITCAVICNDSNIIRSEGDALYKITGSSTEGALLILSAKLDIFKENFSSSRVEEIPFDSQRKMMSVLYKADSEQIVYAKGAPEVILHKSTYIQTEHGIEPLTEEERNELVQVNQKLTSQAFRSLAFGYKINESDTYTEDRFIFLGFVGIEDPPREEVAEAISLCKQSGIKVKMITGDNKETAQAVAQQIGIFGNVLTGMEMDKLSDDELSKVVAATAIFARVKPEDKLRIVKALKANNEIVTMTGDGVNDAPALKEAHIGVAMGINGTDVSRSVADITLKDDNFATIVVAIKEGRTIFNNIRKFVTYQLSNNMSFIYIVFVGMILSPYLGWYIPIISALQILFMNIVTDNMPALTLGFNNTSKDIMMERPRKNAQILTNEFIDLIIVNGICMGMLALFVAYLSYNVLQLSSDESRSTVLVSMIFIQIANAYNFRSFRYLVFTRSLFVNKYLIIASILSITATLAIIYTPLSIIFETTALGAESWLLAVASAILIVVIFDIQKIINNKTKFFMHHVH